MVQEEAPTSWKIVELVFLRKQDAEPKKGIRSCRAIALTSVVSTWCMQKKRLGEWKQMNVGGIEGISCQHLQVMTTQSIQKHWEWQEDRKNVWHGSENKTDVHRQYGHQVGF